MPEIENHLVLTAVGPWRDRLSIDLLKAIRDRGCEVRDCRVAPIADSYAACLLITGNWSSVGKLETALPGLAEKLGISLQFLRSKERDQRGDMRPFAAELSAPQQPDLLMAVLDFFHGNDVVATEIVCQDYESSHTGAAMCNIQLVLFVPTTQHPPALRESFMDLCDELNADGILDPMKN